MIKAMSRALSIVPYELIDIGANLGHPGYKNDLEQVLERAQKAGLSKIMITGTSEKISKEACELSSKYPGFLYFTAGVHPHDAKEFGESSLDTLRVLAKNSQCVAIGECGLDFNRNFSPQDQQLKVFEEQVKLACELKKSLFIHEREASDDLIRILSKYQNDLPLAVIHCFTGTAKEAQRYIDLGYYIGLTGFLWKDRSEDGVKYALQNRLIPLERLVLETDAPYMYPKIDDKKIPAAIREKISPQARELHKFASFNRNEPCALASICELIAAFMNETPEKVAEMTTANAKRIYGLN